MMTMILRMPMMMIIMKMTNDDVDEEACWR
jgi:hypothetical protein